MAGEKDNIPFGWNPSHLTKSFNYCIIVDDSVGALGIFGYRLFDHQHFPLFQFLERFYDLMVNNNEDLTMKVMLNAFSNIAK